MVAIIDKFATLIFTYVKFPSHFVYYGLPMLTVLAFIIHSIIILRLSIEP